MVEHRDGALHDVAHTRARVLDALAQDVTTADLRRRLRKLDRVPAETCWRGLQSEREKARAAAHEAVRDALALVDQLRVQRETLGFNGA